MNIGVLDDNPDITGMLKVALEMKGHAIHVFTSGIQLLDALEPFFVSHESRTFSSLARFPFDLLIVDLFLPDEMSGIDVITTIEQRLFPSSVPAILITGSGEAQIEQAHAALPAVPILRKPFKLSTLFQIIEQVHCLS